MENFEREVLDRLARIEAKINNGLSDRIFDHEKRIRLLEKALFMVGGAIILIQIILKLFVK